MIVNGSFKPGYFASGGKVSIVPWMCGWESLDSPINFDVLLTVHLSIFILVINQLDAQNLFYNKFISCLYMFRAPCAHRQEVKIVLYSLWYHDTYRCDDTMWKFYYTSSVKILLLYSIWYHHTCRCDDTRGCIIQFCPPEDEHMVLETCRGMK